MVYYYPTPDTKTTYKPKTESQRNHLARKIAKTEQVKRAIKLAPELRDIIYKLKDTTYKEFLRVGKLEKSLIPNTYTKFIDKEISRKDLDKYITLIFQGR